MHQQLVLLVVPSDKILDTSVSPVKILSQRQCRLPVIRKTSISTKDEIYDTHLCDI